MKKEHYNIDVSTWCEEMLLTVKNESYTYQIKYKRCTEIIQYIFIYRCNKQYECCTEIYKNNINVHPHLD